MQLRVTHETCYDYVPAVSNAQHMAFLQPVSTSWQQVEGYSLQVSPEPAHCVTQNDVYGNVQAFFSLQTPHSQLSIVAQTVLATQSPQAAESTQSWESVRDCLLYSPDHSYEPATEFSFASPNVPLHLEFHDYAAPSFLPGQSFLLSARNLMQRIHRDFEYASQSTGVNTPALEAFRQGRGVCQDFAHIMLACLRTMGLPARYVSGYVLTHPAPGQPRLVGSDASHAWISVYLPDLLDAVPSGRWYDLDPTNDRDGWGTPGEDYVRLAIGRDFSDVSPIRGVIHGGANHQLAVAVTVEPIQTEALLRQVPAAFQTQSQSQGQSQSQHFT